MKYLISLLMLHLVTVHAYSADYFWVNGQGDWYDFSNHWATSSGGNVFHVAPPGPDDDVYFDVNSFSNLNDTLFVDERKVYCRKMDWTGVANQPVVCHEHTDQFAVFMIFGDLILSPNIVWLAHSEIKMTGNSGLKLIKTFNLPFPDLIFHVSINLDCASCQWELGSDIKACINLNAGDFNSNGYKIDGCFSAYLPTAPILPGIVDLDTSKINGVINIGYTADIDSAEFYGTVYITDSNSVGRISGGNAYLVDCTVAEIHSIVVNLIHTEVDRLFIDPDSFCYENNFCNAIINQNQSIVHYAELMMSEVYIAGGEFDTLKLTKPGANISLEDTIRVNDLWEVNGTCSGLTFLHAADTSGLLPVLELPAENIIINDAVINGVSVTGALSCFAVNSFDQGLNSGIVFQPYVGRTLYWVGGTGNWSDSSHWSLSSGGPGSACVPTFLDTVVIDINSSTSLKDTLIFDAESVYVAEFNAVSVVDSLVFLSVEGFTRVNVGGSLQASSSIYLARNFEFILHSSATGNVLSFNVKLIDEPWNTNYAGVVVDGGGEWNLVSDLEEISLAIKEAVVRTNDFKLKGFLQILETDGYKALYLGNSSVEGGFAISDSTNLFVDADSASMSGSGFTSIYGLHIHKVNADYFYAIHAQVDSLIGARLRGVGCSVAYAKIIEPSFHTLDPSQIYGTSFHFGRLEIAAKRTAIGESSLTANIISDTLILLPDAWLLSLIGVTTLNVLNELEMNGNCNTLLYLEGNSSSMIGVPTGLQQISRMVIKNIQFSGTVNAMQSVDAGGNTGISFSLLNPRTLYWVGGAGSWSDPNHWSLSSGGIGGECIPTQLDSVILDQLSFNTINDTLVASNGTFCRFMDCRNVDDFPILKMNGNQSLFGSLYLSADMQYLLYGRIVLSADSGTYELDFANLNLTDSSKQWPNASLENSSNATWNLLSDLKIMYFYFSNGTFNYNNHSTYTADVVFEAGPENTEVNIGKGLMHSRTIRFGYSGFNGINFVDADSAQIVCNAFTNRLKQMTINDLVCTGTVETDSTYINHLSAYSIRGNYNVVNWGELEQISGNFFTCQSLRMIKEAGLYVSTASISKLNVDKNISFGGFNIFIDSLYIGHTTKKISVGYAGGLHVVSYFSKSTDPQNFTQLISIQGVISDITLPSDTFCFENMAIDNVSVIGGGVYYAGNNSYQIGTCTGWTMSGCTLDTSAVWPGDVNYDQQVSLLDLLYLGITHSYSGSTRSNASLNWTDQPCINWPMVYSNGSNVHNADTDGNGIVNDDDTLGIAINYGLTHQRPASTSPVQVTAGTPVYFQLPGGNLPVATLIDIPLHIGTSTYPQLDAYGMMLTIHFNPTALQPGSVYMDAMNSWLADTAIQLEMMRYDHSAGILQFALVRTDQQNVSGWGEVAVLHFITAANGGFLDLSIANLILIDKNENQILLNVMNSNVHVGVQEEDAFVTSFVVYPNPGTGSVYWKSSYKFIQLEVYDVYGKRCIGVSGADLNSGYDFSILTDGSYIILGKDSNGKMYRCSYTKMTGK